MAVVVVPFKMVDVGPTVMLALVDQDGREVQVRLPREWLRECDEVLDVKLPESVVVDVSFVPWMLLVVLEDVVKGAGVMDVVVDSVVNGPVDTVEAVVDAELVVEVALLTWPQFASTEMRRAIYWALSIGPCVLRRILQFSTSLSVSKTIPTQVPSPWFWFRVSQRRTQSSGLLLVSTLFRKLLSL